MSHFTKLAVANVTSIPAFLAACAEMGMTEVRRNVESRDWNGATVLTEVAVRKPGGKYDVAIVRDGTGKMDLIADWWGVRMEMMADRKGTYPTDKHFQDRLIRDTTKHTIVERYTRQGFRATISEDAEANVTVKLVRA